MVVENLRLGVVGSSSGNGHPYSWSSLINGFDSELVGEIPFPAIQAYLRRHDESGQNLGARVEAIWCPDYDQALHIAKVARISRVVPDVTSLLNEVDAVLHLRSDFQSLPQFLKIYSSWGKPVFVDKPLATSLEQAKQYLDYDPLRQWLFTCSSFAYEPALISLKETSSKTHVFQAVGPNDWAHYSIHLIEPFVRIFNPDIDDIDWFRFGSEKASGLEVKWSNGLRSVFETSGEPETKFEFRLDDEVVEISSPAAAFWETIVAFVKFARKEGPMPSRFQTLRTAFLIERGSS